MRFSIKICPPSRDMAHHWGDYHIAVALKEYFGRHGHAADIQIMPEWYDGADRGCDVVIHLRGISRYNVSKHRLNIMWNISHPEMVSPQEYEDYDVVFVASEVYGRGLRNKVSARVVSLLQCTDPELFYPDTQKEYATDLVFVGNSRGVYRRILKDLLPTQYNLKVWGRQWEQFIDKHYIQGEYFPNEQLRQIYSSCKILLNDHWDDMREHGFINNRIYDALASKAFVISDEVAGLADLFPNALVTYRDRNDLREKIEYYLNNESARREIAEKGYALLTKHHTFNERVQTILSHLQR